MTLLHYEQTDEYCIVEPISFLEEQLNMLPIDQTISNILKRKGGGDPLKNIEIPDYIDFGKLDIRYNEACNDIIKKGGKVNYKKNVIQKHGSFALFSIFDQSGINKVEGDTMTDIQLGRFINELGNQEIYIESKTGWNDSQIGLLKNYLLASKINGFSITEAINYINPNNEEKILNICNSNQDVEERFNIFNNYGLLENNEFENYGKPQLICPASDAYFNTYNRTDENGQKRTTITTLASYQDQE